MSKGCHAHGKQRRKLRDLALRPHPEAVCRDREIEKFPIAAIGIGSLPGGRHQPQDPIAVGRSGPFIPNQFEIRLIHELDLGIGEWIVRPESPDELLQLRLRELGHRTGAL